MEFCVLDLVLGVVFGLCGSCDSCDLNLGFRVEGSSTMLLQFRDYGLISPKKSKELHLYTPQLSYLYHRI